MRTHLLTAPIAATVLAATLAAACHLPATCADPCDVLTGFAGYVAPVIVIESGTEVTWTSLDSTHVQADRRLVANQPECFAVSHGGGATTSPVLFEIDANGLQATVNGVTTDCPNATQLPDGSYELPYYCKLHANMRGEIIVTH